MGRNANTPLIVILKFEESGVTESITRHRHDLGSHLPVPQGIKENICQVLQTGNILRIGSSDEWKSQYPFCLLIKVMWPSVYIEGGKDSSLLHERLR